MTAWEYLTRPTSSSMAELNELGADGWEVVGQTDIVEHQGAGRRVEDRVWLLRRTVRDAAAVTGD